MSGCGGGDHSGAVSAKDHSREVSGRDHSGVLAGEMARAEMVAVGPQWRDTTKRLVVRTTVDDWVVVGTTVEWMAGNRAAVG